MKEPKKTYTKGNIVVQEINVGDIHYEFDYGLGIKCKVLTKPEWDGEGYSWKSKKISGNDNSIISYYVRHDMSHYSPNLYNYEAYKGVMLI